MSTISTVPRRLALAVAAALLLMACGGDDEGSDTAADAATDAQASGTVVDLGGGTGEEAEATVDIVCP